MSSTRSLAVSSVLVALLAPLVYGQDLSTYRDFQFGMSLVAVAQHTGMKTSDAKTIHLRPALIQELEWRPDPPSRSSLQSDSVKDILFSFYNGELFRIVVNYDRDRTEGLTDNDMVEAISAKYGAAKRPAAKSSKVALSQVYDDSEKVVASWEDAQWEFDLFRSSYESGLGMVMLSKRVDALARAAIAKAIRLDEQEAPQRLKDQAHENRLRQEKARLLNKPVFRP